MLRGNSEVRVVTGLYRLVRNPIYIAGSSVLAGEALLFQSKGIFIYFLIMFGIFNVHVLIEETLLAEKFGATYEQYRKSVPRWIPRITPYKKIDTRKSGEFRKYLFTGKSNPLLSITNRPQNSRLFI